MEENQAAREDLATAMRALAMSGMQEGIYNHCTALTKARDGKDRQVILFPPFGVLWYDITPECLIGVDFESGEIVEGKGEILGPGICIHTSIYKRRPEVKSIMHVHSTYATSLSSLKDNRLLMMNQTSMRFFDDVAYDDYKLFDLDTNKEGEVMVQCLGETKRVLMMANHGVATVGCNVAVAFDIMYGLEIACKLQILAMSTGREIMELPEEMARSVRESYDLTLEEDGRKHLDALKHHFERK